MSERQFEVFYDGDCPLCMREIRMLMKLDRKQRVRFTNIADPEFDAGTLGTSYEALMQRIQGRLPDGTWVSGVEVFRRLYAAVGFGPVVSLTRLPGVRGALDWGYDKFAANRLKWTGRCTDACPIPPRKDARTGVDAPASA